MGDKRSVLQAFLGKFGFLSYIGKPVFIGNFKRVFIGNKVRIFPGSRIEVLGNASSIIFKDNVSIGQNLHITSGMGQQLTIGESSTLAENVFITNIEHSYSEVDVHVLHQPLIGKYTEIGENCFIGYGAVIQAGTVLGKQCIVGANAVVKGVFPDYCVIVGVPARIVKRYDPRSGVWARTNNDGDFYDQE
jgi:acetyltransferase-like isoleucine patch superfamily enzyme